MKQKKKHQTLLKLSILALLSAAFVVLAGSRFIEAKSKKTVRVSTEADLIKMMDDSSVGEIIFRSQTCNIITIPANENVKTKSFYVDAPNAIIKNCASFKEVTVDRAEKFRLMASVNTVYLNAEYIAHFTLMEKSTVKNLVIGNYTGEEVVNFYYFVEPGSKVKNISYQYEDEPDKWVKWDKTSRTLTFNEASKAESGEPVTVTLRFDKNGRIKEYRQDYTAVYGWDIIYSYSGIYIKSVKDYKYIDNKKTLVFNYKSENKDLTRTTKAKVYIEEEGVYITEETFIEYNEDNRVLNSEFKNSVDYCLTEENSYDKAGRLKKETLTDNNETVVSKYTYDKNGCVKLVTATNSNYPGKTYYYKYGYDKDGNNIYRERTFYDGKVAYANDKFNELGELLETVYVDENGESHVITPGA